MKEEADEHQQQTLVQEAMQRKSIALGTTIGSSSSCSTKESNEIHSVYNGFNGYDREIQNGLVISTPLSLVCHHCYY